MDLKHFGRFVWYVFPYAAPGSRVDKIRSNRRSQYEEGPIEKLRRIGSHYELLTEDERKRNRSFCAKFESLRLLAETRYRHEVKKPHGSVNGTPELVKKPTSKPGNGPAAADVPRTADWPEFVPSLEGAYGAKTWNMMQKLPVHVLVHQAHLIWLKIQPSLDVETYVDQLSGDLEDIGGGELLKELHTSLTWQKLDRNVIKGEDYEQLLRNVSVFLANAIYKQQQQSEHVETVRSNLIRSVAISTWRCIHFCLCVLGIFVVAHNLGTSESSWFKEMGWHKPDYRDPTLATALLRISACFAVVGMFGAIGAFVSVLGRLQKLGTDVRVGRNIMTLEKSENVLTFAPLAATLFSVILCLIFSTHLFGTGGSLFPTMPTPFWADVIFDGSNLAKLALWSFIAGFSERLVPDMIDGLIGKQAGKLSGAPKLSQPGEVVSDQTGGKADGVKTDGGNGGGPSDSGGVSKGPRKKKVPPGANGTKSRAGRHV
ncbi:MAG TPA: hypothetical protein VGE29_16840 [Prosthecobacter sp.]